MASNRKRMEEAPVLRSWADVDDALRQIALAQIALSDIEGDMNKQILGVTKVAEQQSKPHIDRIGKLERDIKAFAEAHREELSKRKTMALNFGECGYRQSTSVTVPTTKEKLLEIIRQLRARGMGECVNVKETVNKDALRQYGEEMVAAVGARWVQKDVFWYEASRAKLEQIQTERR